MNWDMIINVGMFALGICFMLVALAQLLWGDFDDDDDDRFDGTTADDDYCPYSDFVEVPKDNDEDFEVITEESLKDVEYDDAGLHEMLDIKLNEIQDDINTLNRNEQELAIVMVSGSAYAYQSCIDEFGDE